ncbi:MAG: alpha/beta hydrolase [Dehalococcoidia bacterium]|nr:alpha/beta hydrolase [Dehalococcoidia bacterium]
MIKGYVTLPHGQVYYRTEGGGEPLVLLHQAPLAGVEFRAVAPFLGRDFRVIVPDLPGHGQSDDPPYEYGVDDYARAIVGLMDALGIDRACLGGNHTGSAVSLSIAVNYPARVRKLILSAECLIGTAEINAFIEGLKTRPMSRDIPMDAEGRFLVEAWERYRALAPMAPLEVRFRPFVIGLAARLRPYDAHLPVFRWMARENRLPRLKVPVLIFSGDKDLFYRPELVSSARERIPGCQVAVIPDGGAMVCFEKPRQVAEAFLKFLKG